MTTTDLTGRRAAVTGGASGIGRACAVALAQHGAEVTILDRDAGAAEALAAELGGRAVVVDLADTAALEGISLDTDILVNCAGIQRVAPIHEFEPEMFRTIHRIMLEAPFLLIRAALPGMYERGFGRIINISSVHGLVASAYKVAYVSAKHGLEGLSKVTALEGGPHGVTSVCVNPGYVRTPLVEGQVKDQAATHGISEDEVVSSILLAQSAIKEFVEPDDVAQLVCFLAGPHGRMATGASYVLDGGWVAR
ncbi:MAG: 3-hydroxybutyrate dehydrogenase [Propionibacterium sp.]|nr:3-hydroxybutyrate dehydrogenase [Propionibacterium sp.]